MLLVVLDELEEVEVCLVQISGTGDGSDIPIQVCTDRCYHHLLGNCVVRIELCDVMRLVRDRCLRPNACARSS